jgi:hypothetical protein
LPGGGAPLPGPGPLDVVSVDAKKLPSTMVGGDKKAKGAVSVTVRNSASTNFDGPVTVSVLLSDDAIADVGDVAIAQTARPMKLKAGRSKALKFKMSLATLPAGSFTLLGAATASNLTSAAAGPSLTVQTPVVHLVSGGPATAPAKPITRGKPATLAVPLRNDGNTATTKTPATYTLILSTDGTEAGAVTQTTTTRRINLKPGASKPQKIRFSLPAGSGSAGSFTMLVKVSAELNETNGNVVASIPVTVV